MTRPTILLTNDDGVGSPGIRALANRLSDEADAQIVVVAPSHEQSAVSHKITLHKPIRVSEEGPGWYACSGTPADCVQVALGQILDARPDLVVSGINRGPNLGDDAIYSGTVAGAREGALWGIPAVAFSLAQLEGPFDFTGAAAAAGRVVRALLPHLGAFPRDVVVNVNFPKGVDGSTPWALTRISGRNYRMDVSRHLDPRGRPYYWIAGERIADRDAPGTDVAAVYGAEHVSIAPLPLRRTSDEGLEALRAWGLDGAALDLGAKHHNRSSQGGTP